jgi:hypothetical protein
MEQEATNSRISPQEVEFPSCLQGIISAWRENTLDGERELLGNITNHIENT